MNVEGSGKHRDWRRPGFCNSPSLGECYFKALLFGITDDSAQHTPHGKLSIRLLVTLGEHLILVFSEAWKPIFELFDLLRLRAPEMFANTSHVAFQKNAVIESLASAHFINMFVFLLFQKLQRIDTPHCHSALPCKCPVSKSAAVRSRIPVSPSSQSGETVTMN